MPKLVEQTTEVAPGSETGLYYIPLSNLPFDATWQDLKDYVRRGCRVDHVEIFPKSTSAWVRVEGYENFKKACAHFRREPFSTKGSSRAIVWDERNELSPVRIRVSVEVSEDPGSEDKSQVARTSSRSPATTLSTLSSVGTPGGAPLRPASSGYPSPGSYVYSTPTSTTSPGPYSWSASGSTPGSVTGYGYASCGTQSADYSNQGGYYPPGSSGPYVSNSGGAYTYADYYGQPVAYSDYTPQSPNPYQAGYAGAAAHCHDSPGGAGAAAPPAQGPAAGAQASGTPPGVVYTEHRGIHIRNVSRRAGVAEIRRMITERAGLDADCIVRVDVPVKDKAPRGFAMVNFTSGEVAQRMVARFDGHEFNGRAMQARLLVEGEPLGGGEEGRGGGGGGGGGEGAGGGGSAGGGGGSHHGHGDKRDRKSRDKDKSGGGSHRKESRSVLIVDGTSHRKK